MPKTIDKQLIDAIARAEANGLTRYRIAKNAGLREPHLHRIADGEATPKITTAAAILEAIGGSFTIKPPAKRKT